MHRLILGTAGHIDHGKTALVRALTGIDTDRLLEEKQRGITIDLGFASLALPNGVDLGIVDVPGHEAFVRNMLAGATGIDLGLLVVAADEGVMPQTREHLAIMQLLAVPRCIVALTKIDSVDPDWQGLVVDELTDLLADSEYDGAPIVPVSAVTGAGLDNLRETLTTTTLAMPEHRPDDLFRLPIDRVFSIHGTGTVVTGTIWSGSIRRDRTAHALPSATPVRVRGIQVHGSDREDARAGERTALALAGTARSALARGETLVSDPGWRAASMLTARLSVLPDCQRPVRARQRVRLHLGTAQILGRVATLEGETVEPGQEAWVQFRLEAPTVARAGDRFVIRSYSPVTTIGGGVIAEPQAPKRKRLDRDQITMLTPLAAGPVSSAVEAAVQLAGWAGVPIPDLPVLSGATPLQVHNACQAPAILQLGDMAVAPALVRKAQRAVLTAVDDHHHHSPLDLGMERQGLRTLLPATAAPGLADRVVDDLVREERLVVREGRISRAGFSPHLDAEQATAADRLCALLARSGLTPPDLSDYPEELRTRPDLRPLLGYLERNRRVVQVTPERFLDAAVVEQAAAALRSALNTELALTPADLKTIFPISRKFLIPLLEYFDRTGLTIRLGDRRLLGRA